MIHRRRPVQSAAGLFASLRRGPALSALLPGLSLVAAIAAFSAPAHAVLADRPINATGFQPANLLLTLSVEWPTANVQAYNDETSGTGFPGRDGGRSACYFTPPERAARVNAANVDNAAYTLVDSLPYQGYFNPYMCYTYDTTNNYFKPVERTIGFEPVKQPTKQPATSEAMCNAKWSGNFLNWATMQTIDMFRWAMTGGDRSIDTATKTVLRKARHDGQGGTSQFPIKQVGRTFSDIPKIEPGWVTPYTGESDLYLEIQGLNTAMKVSGKSDMSTTLDTFQVAVEVCNSDVAKAETTTPCKAYGTSLKPVGLVQEHSEVMRFGAFGYLLDSTIERDGGVMRARMKFVGPTRPELSVSASAANTHAEWSATDGTFIKNPDPADATATSAAIVKSGVIQYINTFGRDAALTTSAYKSYDPVSELFYEGIRYYKNLAPTPEYSALSGASAAAKRDGFPVITSWDDPMARPAGFESASEWCPKNFVIGIADSNTHRDKRLPGNTYTQDEGAAQPSNPDTSINVMTLLDEIIDMELDNEGVTARNSSGGALTSGPVNCCSGSAYLASLAFYANAHDIRPDTSAIHTKGKQSVKTFFIDVRESGSWGTGQARTAERRRNQLWLAAKYGGFDDRNGNGKLDDGDAVADLNGDGNIDVRDVWDQNGDWLPDTYFEADSPERLVAGLRSAFGAIRAEIETNAAVGVAGAKSQLRTDTGLYQSNFDPSNWSGDVAAFTYNGVDTGTGEVSATPVWSAAAKIASQDWSTGRRIVTMARASKTTAATAPRAFRWNELTTFQQESLGEEAVLEYLRGNHSDARFRTRLRAAGEGNIQQLSSLGDVVDSSPRYVGPPSARLSDLYNPGYGTFVTAKANRTPMLYVGVNDGMMHAIDARVDTTNGGKEVWAYVPSVLFAGVRAPDDDGLRALTKRDYVHRFYVNATVSVGDVDFGRTKGNSGAADWRTILVGGLGKGGRSFYALDVTDGGSVTSEAQAKARVLWEFEDSKLGYSYGKPQIVKTKRWGWVVLLTSGYDNIAATGSDGGGQGFLYVVDIKTGDLLQRIGTTVGSDEVPAGLSEVTAYTPNSADGTITEVYGGDLLGNLWRFDFTSAEGSIPAPMKMATLASEGGVVQPITTGPIIRIAPVTRVRHVFVGTGKLLEPEDPFNAATQTFYAIKDGTRAAPFKAGDDGAPSFPIARSALVENATLLTQASIATDKYGWYHDLGATGERVIVDPQDTDVGKISWLGSIPNSVGLCTGDGSSRVYVTDFATGQSQLYKDTESGPERIAAFDPGTAGVGLQLVRVGNNIHALITGSKKSLKVTQGYLQYQVPRTLNWREITEQAD